jgi:hypothetical protein
MTGSAAGNSWSIEKCVTDGGPGCFFRKGPVVSLEGICVDYAEEVNDNSASIKHEGGW